VADGPTASGRRRLGIQARLTVAATALVALVLVGGAVVLSLALRHTLLSNLDASARQRARDVATLVDTGNLPNTVPVAGGTVLVQVVDDQDRVRAGTPGGDALVPLLSGRPLADARRGVTQQVPGSRIGISDQLRVVGTVAGHAAGRRTVLVAVSATEASRSLRAVVLVLVVGVPLLVAAFALVCWFLVGAALRPVAALRRGAGAITEAGTGARLPVPGTRDEVAHLAETLNDMLDRLAAAGARQRAFVADAAHELRSPLTSMRTQLEVARAHPRVADWDETSEGVLVDVDRLSRLVDDLLTLARLDDGRRPSGRSLPIELNAIAVAAIDRPVGRIPVRIVGTADPVLALADRDAVVRVVENLLSNADRYAKSCVLVEVQAAGAWAILTVSDDGPGIPAADRARVFERFARLDASRSQDSGGSGLGLAIVRQLVAASGGSIHLEDAEPGLRAVVQLPLATAVPPETMSPTMSPTMSEPVLAPEGDVEADGQQDDQDRRGDEA
jgi:signal transduction histidine kinase